MIRLKYGGLAKFSIKLHKKINLAGKLKDNAKHFIVLKTNLMYNLNWKILNKERKIK